MPDLAYKCSGCKTVYDAESDACICEAKHQAPMFIRIGEGGCTMRKKQSMYTDCEGYEFFHQRVVYYRDAGQWEVSFTVKDGKSIAVGNGPTKHLDGDELIPCTGQDYRDDNRGYV